MKYFCSILLLPAIFCSILPEVHAQTTVKYTVENAHAHNDYRHTVPFYSAFNNGFGSIEADVFPVNGELLVAHGKSEIQKEKTLSRLYLNPLQAELKKYPARNLYLLVDIKENFAEALSVLIKQLTPLKKYLSTPQRQGNLTVLISGNRPKPAAYSSYPDYLFFDADQSVAHTAEQWKRVGLVSLNFTKLSNGKSDEKSSAENEARLKHTIDSVHNAGKKIRFWAAPDNEAGWMELMKLGVDLIGTDKIEELAVFLNEPNKGVPHSSSH